MSIDLHELRRKADAATPGPWWWGGNVDNHGDVGLRGRHPGLGVVDVLRTTPEDVDEESAGREWDTSDVSDYIGRDEWIEMRVTHPHRFLAFLRADDLFVEEGRDKAVFEVARNQGLPDDTPRDHPKVYRGDVVAIRNANAEYIAAASPEVLLALLDRVESAERGLFRIVQALGFDTDDAKTAEEFFGPLTVYADRPLTSAEDIAVHLAEQYRADAEAESDQLEGLNTAEKAITEALAVTSSASVPLGVPEARHWDRLLAETRRVLSTYEKGTGAQILRDEQVTERPAALVGYRRLLVERARAAADEFRRFDDTEEVVATLVEIANELIKASATVPGDADTETWEYGWVSNFEDGEEYEWLACGSREDAERQVRENQAEEDVQENPGHLTYTVRRRRPGVPGPWEPAPEVAS